MRFMTAGLAQEFPVYLLDFGILMRFAHGLGTVLIVKGFGAQLLRIDIHKLACGKVGWPPPVTQPPGQP